MIEKERITISTAREKLQFPIWIWKNRRDYMATVTQGEGITLQAPDSDISLTVPRGVRSTIMGHIHTNYTCFRDVIPRDECIISPMVEFHSQELGVDEGVGPYQYKIRIPHCFNRGQLSAIRVRCGDIYRPASFKQIENKEQAEGSSAWFEVDERFVTIYTDHFSRFTCTSCNRCCHASIMSFLYGYLVPRPRDMRTILQIKFFLCSSLYSLKDFQAVRTSYNFISI